MCLAVLTSYIWRILSHGYRQAIAHIRTLYPSAPLLAVGWSCGGNRMVHYLAEEGDASPLVAAMSLCNIWSLVYGDTHCKFSTSRGAWRLVLCGFRVSLNSMTA